MKKINLSVSFCIIYLWTLSTFSQVGIGTTNPDPASILDISSTTQGVLTPRMTSTERIGILAPSQGLLVFDIDENHFYVYDSTVWVKLISEKSIGDYTGWASYTDALYTSTSPYSLAGNTKVTLPNNALITLDTQKPVDVSTFYDVSTQTITGRNGDGVNIVIEFKLRPIANQNTKITVAIDIGGSIGEIYIRDFLTSKGIGVQHYYLSSFDAYTLNTWEANGGAVKIISDYAVEIFDIRYVITRTHKAK